MLVVMMMVLSGEMEGKMETGKTMVALRVFPTTVILMLLFRHGSSLSTGGEAGREREREKV